MTAKEAIMQIQAIPEKIWNQLSEPDNEAINMAISALQEKDSPKPIAESVQNVQNEDLISRKAAIDALGERPMVWTDDDQYALGERNQYDIDRLAIETLPSAQPEVIHCKDCKYCDRGIDEDGNPFLKCLGWVYGGTQEEDFCSHAERRTE